MVSAMMGSTFATAARTCATAQRMFHVPPHRLALVLSYTLATTSSSHTPRMYTYMYTKQCKSQQSSDICALVILAQNDVYMK